jgi:trans-aconitate methyltransferase
MSEQRWSPAQYARDAAFVYESSNDLVAWLDPKPDERILDLGCGTGVHVEAIAARGAHPTGLDGSAAMIDAAKQAYHERAFVVGRRAGARLRAAPSTPSSRTRRSTG